MNTLVAYYSYTRNNEVLAQELQRRTGGDLYRIEEEKKRTGFTILVDLALNRKPRVSSPVVPLDHYDQVIFLAPIWASKIATPLKAFLLNEKNKITRYAFLTLCGGGLERQKGKIEKQLTSIVGHAPVAVEELWVNDILPEEQKNIAKYATSFRLQQKDLEAYDDKINAFLDATGALART